MSNIDSESEQGFRSSDGGPAGDPTGSGGPSPAEVDQPQEKLGAREITKPPRCGEKDANGYTIDTIFWSTRQFVLYEADDQIRYMLPDNYEIAKTMRSRVADLGGLRASIDHLKTEPALSTSEKTRASREMAWALAQAFEDDAKSPSVQPKEILTQVDGRLRSLLKSYYRKNYVLANLIAFVFIEALLTMAVVIFAYFGDAPPFPVLSRYSLYALFGALGAFMSVITGIRSVDVDLDLKGWEHIITGATRILIGVIGAVIIGLALDSGLVNFSFGSGGEEETPGSIKVAKHLAMILIFSFIAGFSESLVPSIMRRGEQAVGTDRSHTPDDPIVKDTKP